MFSVSKIIVLYKQWGMVKLIILMEPVTNIIVNKLIHFKKYVAIALVICYVRLNTQEMKLLI